MTNIIKGLSEIVQNYDALFCDVWGVFHNGQSAFPDAVEALMQARLKGLQVFLVTNSPKTPSWVAKQIERMNAPNSSYDRIVTAGQALQYSLYGTKYKKFYFIGSTDDQVIYTDPPEGVSVNMERTTDYKAADVIICAGPEYGVRDELADYELELQQLYSRRLPMYCGNPDKIVDHGENRIICGGAIAEMYANLGGTVYQFGKPFPPIYQLARDELQNDLGRDISASRILFIGDGVETDLKGAMLEDMDALFVAGGLAAAETGVASGQFDSDKVENYLNQHKLDPLYSIEKLKW